MSDGDRARRPMADQGGASLDVRGTSRHRGVLDEDRDLAEHFRLALEAGQLGTWRWNRATGDVVWDERLEALYGLPPGGFDGTFEAYEALLHPDDRERVLAAVRAAVEGKASYRVTHKVIWRDGTVHWIVGAGNVTVDDDGNVTGTIGCSMDITDQVEHEQQLEQLAATATAAAATERALRERFEFLSTVNDALNASTRVDDIMVNVTRAAVPRLGDWCAIHVLRGDDPIPKTEVAHVDPDMVAYARELQAQFPYDPQAATGIPNVIRSGEPEFYPDIDAAVLDDLDLDDEARTIVERLALRSSVSVPIIKQGRVHGAMQFVLCDPVRRYGLDDLVLAQLIAARIAVSLENRRLNDEQRHIAETLQRSLLPARLPSVPGIDIAVRYWAAGDSSEVGGDFYDVFALERDDSWAIVIGDVCGTGPTAAAVTGLARHTIRTSAWRGDAPSEVMAALNTGVLRADTGAFLTAIYGTLERDADDVTLTFVAAGHPLPIAVTERGSCTVGRPGTLLGVFPDATTHVHTERLTPGDVIVLYTDGATDVAPPHLLTPDEFAGLVDDAVRSIRDPRADDIADQILNRLERVLSVDRRDDDIAMLVVRVE